MRSKEELYVCQNGGTVGAWRTAEMVAPPIQRVSGEGSRAEILVTSIDGVTLDSPNDLVFSADGSPYITGPGAHRASDPDLS